MKRFREMENGYRYDKLVFFGVFLVFIGLVFYTMLVNKFDFSTHPFYVCNQEVCENPFYAITDCQQQINILFVIPVYKTQDCKLTCDWCNEKYLTYGIYGERPKAEFLLNYMWLVGIGLIILGFVLNHFIHNKGKKFDIELVITEKKKLSLNKLLEKKDEINQDNKQN